MGILLVLLFLIGLYLLQKWVYRHRWDRGLSVRLQFENDFATVDETAVLIETITNEKRLPLPVVEVDFHVGRGLVFQGDSNASVSDRSYRRDVFALGARQKIMRPLRFRCAHRGYYTIAVAGLCGSDLLLCAKYHSARPQSTDFYVLPRPVDAGQLVLPFSQVMGSLLSHKKLFDDPFAFAGIRDYARTDPMKRINWKATAHTGRMLVNLYETTLSRKVVMLLDVEGLGNPDIDLCNEGAIALAAAFCERLLGAGVPIDVYSNGTDCRTGAPLRVLNSQGRGSVLPFQKQLACLLPQNNLPSVSTYFPKETRQSLPPFALLFSQSYTEALACAALFPGEDFLWVCPYRHEKPGVALSPQLQVFWYAC